MLHFVPECFSTDRSFSISIYINDLCFHYQRRLLAAEMNPNKLHVSKKDRFRVYKKYPESQKPLPDDSDTGNQSLDKMKMSEAGGNKRTIK